MDPRIRIHTTMSWIRNTGEKNVGHDEQTKNQMCSHMEPSDCSSCILYKAWSGVQSSGRGNLRQWNPQVSFLVFSNQAII
jgi:hypothetical protein